MAISKKMLKFKFQFLFTFTFATAIITAVLLAPRFIAILAYFWPLLLSTALSLLAVVVIGKTQLPVAGNLGDKSGEGLLDYVAGSPAPPFDGFE